MKAQPVRTVLVCNLSDDRYGKMDLICRRLGLRLHRISEEEVTSPIAALLGFQSYPEPSDKPAPMDPFVQELMVLFNMDNGTLNQFLNACHKQDVVIDYKAMVTPYNLGWTPAELCTELALEHEAMQNQ